MQSRHDDDTKPKLICFDFDQTITNGHFYKYLHANRTAFSSCSLEDTVRSLITSLGIKNQVRLVEVINQLIANNQRVAIVTFNPLVDIIRETLIQIGLAEDVVARIYIDGELPSPGTNRKNAHLERAMRLYSITDPRQVCLVDDDPLNLNAAGLLGIHTIAVPMQTPFDAHLEAVEEFVSIRFAAAQATPSIAAATDEAEVSHYAEVRGFLNLTSERFPIVNGYVTLTLAFLRTLRNWNPLVGTALQQFSGIITSSDAGITIAIPERNQITLPILGMTTDEIRFKKRAITDLFTELLGEGRVNYRKGEPYVDISFSDAVQLIAR
jgi:FMN phosphatase YigB (HAD superfamily)